MALNTSTQKTLLPYLALAAGVIALSLSAIFVRWANAPGAVMSFYRMMIASVVISPFFFRHVQKAHSINRRILPLALLGGLFISLDHGLWSTSITYTNITNATLLNNTAPLWVALIAWLIFKEQLSRRFWIGLLLTLFGTVIVFSNSFVESTGWNGGDLIALGSGLFYAAYFLVTQRAREVMDTLTYIWIAVLTAATILLIFILISGLALSGYPPSTYFAFLAAGLFSQVIGYFSVGYALGHVPASVVAPTMIAQPVLTMVLAIPLAGEFLHPAQIIGAAAVLGGIYLVNRR